MQYVISGPKDYLSQRDNKLYPLSSCNTTSAIMFLNIAKIKYEWDRSRYPQAEDALTAITESPEAYEVMRRDYPWTWDGRQFLFKPRTVHGMLDWAMQKLVGWPVARFRMNTPLEELVLQIVRRRPVILAGRLTASGHMVVLVGVETNQDLSKISSRDEVVAAEIVAWMVNDPFGNWNTNYLQKVGDRVRLTGQSFMKLMREFWSPLKWAHLEV